MEFHLQADKVVSLVKEESGDQTASYLKPISFLFSKATPRKTRTLIP